MPRQQQHMRSEVEDVVEAVYDYVLEEVECLEADDKEAAVIALREKLREYIRRGRRHPEDDDDDEDEGDG